MDYSKITVLVNKHRLTKKELAEILHVTPHGVNYKFENETFTVKDLESIAKYFQVPVSYFLEDNYNKTEQKAGLAHCEECSKRDAIIELLNDQIKSKDEMIASLNRELGRNYPGERAKAG
jgi:transcriptional regulator with XRE-family HTH domain